MTHTYASTLLTTTISVQTTTISISAASCSPSCMFRQLPSPRALIPIKYVRDNDPLKELDRIDRRKYLLNYYRFLEKVKSKIRRH